MAIVEATSSRSHQVESWEERAVSGQMVLSKMTDNSSRGSDNSDSSSLFRDPEANYPEVAEKSELHKAPSHRLTVQTRATPEERKVQSAATHRARCPCVPALLKFIYTSHRGNVINITEIVIHPLRKHPVIHSSSVQGARGYKAVQRMPPRQDLEKKKVSQT